MRLLAVQIDQFGQFINQRFEFPDPSLLIIQGQNEAGKTTLVTFIKYMLFGFPKRSDLKPMGIDTANEGLFGGRLELVHLTVGRVVIERYFKKAGGQAVLYLEDGHVLGEEKLKEWLHGLDLTLFEAIFCINLDRLGELQRLKDETLQHYLFSTGMLGNSRILELEKQLDKETSDRFKPNGRLPVINQKITELEEIRAARLAWEKKKAAYHQMQEEKASLVKRLNGIKRDRTTVLEERQHFTAYKALEPRLIRFQELKSEMATFENRDDAFPEEGLRRYESWRTQLVTLEGEKADLEYQIRVVEENLSKLESQFDQRWIEKRVEIQKLLKEEATFNTLKFEKAKLEERLTQERGVFRALIDQLVTKDWEAPRLEDRIKEIDTGLQMKQHLSLSLQELERLSRESDYIEREISTVHLELDRDQSGLEGLTLLSPEEQAEAEALLELAQAEPARKRELMWLTEQLKALKQKKAASKRIKAIAYILPLLGVILSALLFFIIGTRTQFSIGGLVGGISLLLTLVFSGMIWFFKRDWTLSEEEFTALNKRLTKLQEEENLLLKKRSLIDRYQNEEKERTHRERREERRNELTQRLKEREEEWQTLQQLMNKRIDQLTSWLMEKGYPHLQDVTIALDYVERLEQAKQRFYSVEWIENELETYQSQMVDFSKRWDDLKSVLDFEASTIDELRHQFEATEELGSEKAENEKTKSILLGRVHSLNERIARFNKECYNLMEQAGVDTEDAYFKKEAWIQQKEALRKELNELERQLKIAYAENDFEQNLEWLNNAKWHAHSFDHFDQELEEMEEQGERLGQLLEDLNVQIRQVEEDPHHATLPHQFEKVRDELKQEAYEWAVFKTARGLLDQAKETYKSQRLPQLLKVVEGLFQTVTGGKYTGLYYNETEGFSVESHEGRLFKVETLSRGTSEQLYLVIRLALINLFDHPITLPLIVDDGFVNFDPTRLNGVMRVLQHVSDERQVLVLSCHFDPPPTLFMEEWKKSSRKVEN
jgi:uncharacterized protein YhaN